MKKQFMLLPRDGLHAPNDRADGRKLMAMAHPDILASSTTTPIEMGGETHHVNVLDSMVDNGGKLIEMDEEAGNRLVASQGDGEFRIHENKIYRPMAVRPEDVHPKDAPHEGAAASKIMTLSFTITDARTGEPVEGATVMVYMDQASGKGTGAVTDANGKCTTHWLKSLTTIQQIWVMPNSASPVHWGYLETDVPLQESYAFAMEPVEPTFPDCFKFFYPEPSFDTGAPVTVGIIDTGVAAEATLNLVGGENTVQGDDPSDYGSNGDPHGTHVAGLVGANGPMKGTAPGVALRSYRVFGSGGTGATSFAIIKGVLAGVRDGCDVLNMSLGVDGDDPPLKEAITHARDQGVLIVAGGNNNGGGPVGSPAQYKDCVGISSIGQSNCLPPHAQARSHISDVRGSDPDCFFADFSCQGPQINLTGPGVGVVSTVPGGQYGQLSGTSMAAPAVAGYAARLLGQSKDILTAARDRSRADALAETLTLAARSLGLAADQQGDGLPHV